MSRNPAIDACLHECLQLYAAPFTDETTVTIQGRLAKLRTDHGPEAWLTCFTELTAQAVQLVKQELIAQRRISENWHEDTALTTRAQLVWNALLAFFELDPLPLPKVFANTYYQNYFLPETGEITVSKVAYSQSLFDPQPYSAIVLAEELTHWLRHHTIGTEECESATEFFGYLGRRVLHEECPGVFSEYDWDRSWQVPTTLTLDEIERGRRRLAQELRSEYAEREQMLSGTLLAEFAGDISAMMANSTADHCIGYVAAARMPWEQVQALRSQLLSMPAMDVIELMERIFDSPYVEEL